MNAIRVHEFGPPEVMKLENVPDPAPGPGQVVVRVHAAGVNPVETYIRSGVYALKPPLPYTPGGDAAGVEGQVTQSDGLEFADQTQTAGGGACAHPKAIALGLYLGQGLLAAGFFEK